MNSESTITEVMGMANEPPFTEGPYAIRSVGTPHLEDCPEFQIRCGQKYIATVDSSGDENEANAALLSAAPDLYYALENLRGYSDTFHPADWYAAEAALSKATGETQ